MATILRKTALAAGTALLLASPGGAEPRPIRIPLPASQISLDPTGVQDAYSLLVARQLHCQLVRMRGRDPVPEAAETVEFVTPTRVRMRLREGLKFSDGSPVTSRDVLATFELLRSSRLVLRNVFQWIEQVIAIDGRTVEFRLSRPVPSLLKFLGAPNYAILPAEFTRRVSAAPELWRRPIGCGLYRLGNWDADRLIELEPIGPGLPLQFKLGVDATRHPESVDSYDILDAVYADLVSTKVDFREVGVFDPRQMYIGINSTLPRWQRREDRCRLLSKIDLSAVVRGYGSLAETPTSYFPRGVLGFSSGWAQPHPPDDASGPVAPFSLALLELSVPESKRDFYLNALRPAADHPKVVLIRNASHFGTDFLASGADAIVIGLKASFLDGYEFLTMFLEPTSDITGFKGRSLSQKISQSQLIGDAALRSAAYQEVAAIITEECLVMPLVSLPRRRIFVRNGLETPGIGEVPLNEYDLSKAR